MMNKNKPFIAVSEITQCIYIIDGDNKYDVTDQVIKAMIATGRIEEGQVINNDE